MSLGYSITVIIDAKYNNQNILHLLKKGHEHNFTYHQFILGETNIHTPSLSSEDATNSVLHGLPEDNLHCLTLQIQNTHAILHFLDDGVHMMIMLSGLSHLWSKKFIDGYEDIDIARYTKALLDLVSDFRILEMRIEKD